MGSSKSKNKNASDILLHSLLLNQLKNTCNHGNMNSLTTNRNMLDEVKYLALLKNQQNNLSQNNNFLGQDDLANQRLNSQTPSQNVAVCSCCLPCSYFSPHSYSSCYTPLSVRNMF
jgi:hypothetical protein